MIFDIIQLDESGRLFLSPNIDDWDPIRQRQITAVIDLDGGLDVGVPTTPNQLVYVYFPIQDGELPHLEKLHALARFGADLVQRQHRVLSHCGMGLNRSALVAGVILSYLGMPGPEAVTLLQSKRPGALYNEKFAAYVRSLPAGALRR